MTTPAMILEEIYSRGWNGRWHATASCSNCSTGVSAAGPAWPRWVNGYNLSAISILSNSAAILSLPHTLTVGYPIPNLLLPSKNLPGFASISRVVLVRAGRVRIPGLPSYAPAINSAESPRVCDYWISSFLSGRGQQCKINGLLSSVVDIGLIIV